MSKPVISCTLRKRYLPFLLLLLLPALACKASVPATATASPAAINEIRINYPTGIETRRLENGLIAVVDEKGSYAFVLPEQWEAGAFHEGFIPSINKYAESNPMVKSSFDAIYRKDDSLRVFAIDTSPAHLTKDSMAILHVRLFQDERRLQTSIRDLGMEYANNANCSNNVKIKTMEEGQTDTGVPFAILLPEPITVTDETMYEGALLFKTDKAYIEMIYTTSDKTINIVNEVALALRSLTSIKE